MYTKSYVDVCVKLYSSITPIIYKKILTILKPATSKHIFETVKKLGVEH